MREEMLDDVPIEFPRLDERYAGKAYRHGFAVGSVEEALGGSPTFNAVFHWDLATGKRQTHELGPRDACGEAIFVPRSPDAPEGQGFVLVLVYRGELDRNDLLVLDAENVAGEPLAVIETPHRIPHGFHGNWRPA